MFIYLVSSAAVAWIFELKQLQQIDSTVSLQSTAKDQILRLETTLFEQYYCDIFVDVVREDLLRLDRRSWNWVDKTIIVSSEL